jgi:hypothetical protein
MSFIHNDLNPKKYIMLVILCAVDLRQGFGQQRMKSRRRPRCLLSAALMFAHYQTNNIKTLLGTRVRCFWFIRPESEPAKRGRGHKFALFLIKRDDEQ